MHHSRFLPFRQFVSRCVFVGILCCPVLLSAAEPLKQIPGHATLQAFLNEVSDYSARFKQTLYDEYGELLEESEGQVVLAKPGKFRWEYQQPYRQQIISDGVLLWVYDEDLEQVTINKVPADASQSPLALLVNGVDIESRYQIEAVVREGEWSWLGLTPRAADADYQRVEIAVNDVEVVAMRLHDNLNQLTELTFLDRNKQPTIDQRTFEFAIPDGVDVVNGVVE